MASKKTKKKTTRKPAARTSRKPGQPRECGVCHKLGHNKRSHDKGGKLAK